jgi:hypothetical protein
MAMRDSGLSPYERRVSNRRWVLVASERVLDRPCSMVLRISCWNFLIVLASLTNAGSRHRVAQASQPISRGLRRRGRGLGTPPVVAP